jgi:thiamine pyrophosphate-dependent acetolactate synthase large subunit-like protein
MPQPNTLLTWADVLKLCVPFAFALVLIWAKLAHENRRERKAKQMSLWRSISDAEGSLIGVVDTIARIATAASANKLVVVTFDIPESLSQFANRLAELDTDNAHIYISYSAHLQIVGTGIECLKELNAAYIQSPSGETRERIVKAMGGQTTSVRKDLLTLARRELDILETIYRRNSRFDRQVIDNQKKLIERVSSAIDKHEA